jgi:hypothetical protein
MIFLSEKVVNENNTDAFRIMNVNESGFSTVQKLSGKVRKQQIYALSTLCCVSSLGISVTLIIIFKLQRNNPLCKLARYSEVWLKFLKAITIV